MQFIYPNFLWALSLIIVPILIHLLNLRRHKVVYFSNVNLLKKVKKESRRKSIIKQLIILACRILAIIALVIAFAKPYIPAGTIEKQNATNVVCIYIDNSFSMNAETQTGKAIDNAKSKAFTIINSSKPETKFALLTNSLNSRFNRFYNKKEAIEIVSDIQPSHNYLPMSTAIQRLETMLTNFLYETDKSIFILSDFQKYTMDLTEIIPDSTIMYNLVKLDINSVSNIFIDTCWFEAPAHHLNQTEELNAIIKNQSDVDQMQIPVKFFVNDTLKALTTVDINANSEETITLTYSNLTPGVKFGRIEISDYPITYDNNLYLSYNVNEKIMALAIHSSNKQKNTKNLEALFLNDDYIHLDFMRADQLQISRISNYNTIFLWELNMISSGLIEELKKFISTGGSLVIIPSELINIENYNQLLAELNCKTYSIKDTIEIPVSKIDFNHNIYSDVFKEENRKVNLPTIKSRYRFNDSLAVSETEILGFPDGTTAMGQVVNNGGNIYYFAFSITQGKDPFADHLLFVPTFYNIVLHSLTIQHLYYTLGIDNYSSISVKNISTSQISLKHVQSDVEIIPTIRQFIGNKYRLYTNENIDAGHYKALSNEEVIDGIAYNYNLKESDLEYYSQNEIQQYFEQLGVDNVNFINSKTEEFAATIQDIDSGKQFWKWFLLFALFFLLCEGLVIRFWP